MSRLLNLKKNRKEKATVSKKEMKGLENVKDKKLRLFKLDRRSQMKNFIHFSGDALLVMGENLKNAFLISFDGSIKMPAKIKAPTNYYVDRAPHALLKNEFFVFGGRTDMQKVRKLYKLEN